MPHFVNREGIFLMPEIQTKTLEKSLTNGGKDVTIDMRFTVNFATGE